MNYLMNLKGLTILVLLTAGMHVQSEGGSHSSATGSGNADTILVHIVTSTFIVYGNCRMCERRIEGAFEKVIGVQSADWNVDSKVLTVEYDSEVISLDDIHKKVAEAGHDTDKFRAKDEVYHNLPGCCQYDRPKS